MVKYSTHHGYTLRLHTLGENSNDTKFIFIMDIIIIYINLNEGRGGYVFKNILHTY